MPYFVNKAVLQSGHFRRLKTCWTNSGIETFHVTPFVTFKDVSLQWIVDIIWNSEMIEWWQPVSPSWRFGYSFPVETHCMAQNPLNGKGAETYYVNIIYKQVKNIKNDNHRHDGRAEAKPGTKTKWVGTTVLESLRRKVENWCRNNWNFFHRIFHAL